jgi:hypothetical protein
VAAVNAFSPTLRRYTSLNHLAQAARAVLHNPPQITQMLADLNRVASFCSNGRFAGTTTTTTKLKNQWMMDI